MSQEKKKRKPREKLVKTNDVLYPINITQFGGDKDPCFGKFYDPRAPECSRCGDSELCALKMSHTVKLKRAEQEAQGGFKDLEETQLKTPDPSEIRKAVKSRIRELIKLSGKAGITTTDVISDVHAIYNKRGYTKKKIEILLDKVAESNVNIHKLKNGNLIWKR